MLDEILKAEMQQISALAKERIIQRALKCSTLIEALEVTKKEAVHSAAMAEILIMASGNIAVDFPGATGDTFDIIIEVVKRFEAKNKETSFAS